MKQNNLTDIQLNEIRIEASNLRRSCGFSECFPIANSILNVLSKKDIKLIEYPIGTVKDNGFSAALLYSESRGKELAFISLNTSDYYDKQIFAIAHELYHYVTKSALHISRYLDDNDTQDIIENSANRFAAEFLLPKSEFKNIILSEFKTYKLYDINHNSLLRFIARIHCTWWLPYHSIVKRLYELASISDVQYQTLYAIDERNVNSEYYKLGLAINKEIFEKLNTATNKIGVSENEIETIIRNFENGLISEKNFLEVLEIFNHTPEDFGYTIEIDDEDLNDLDILFNEGDIHES